MFRQSVRGDCLVNLYYSETEILRSLPCFGAWRSSAAFCNRFMSLVPDDKDDGGGFDDVVDDGVELVDLEYPFDLGKQSLVEAKVAAGKNVPGVTSRERVTRMVRCATASIGEDSEQSSRPRPTQRGSGPPQLASPRRGGRPRRLHSRC